MLTPCEVTITLTALFYEEEVEPRDRDRFALEAKGQAIDGLMAQNPGLHLAAEVRVRKLKRGV